MNRDDTKMLKNAQAYAKRRGIRVIESPRLGHGSDGAVWKTSVPSAVKALYDPTNYTRELECYKRLKFHGVTSVNGFNVPVLEGFDSRLLVLELSFVTPPFLLDFGKVNLDRPASDFYDKQQLAEANSRWKSLFDDKWDDVSVALYILWEKYGIYYVDPRPGNINCGKEGDGHGDWEKEPEIDYESYE